MLIGCVGTETSGAPAGGSGNTTQPPEGAAATDGTGATDGVVFPSYSVPADFLLMATVAQEVAIDPKKLPFGNYGAVEGLAVDTFDHTDAALTDWYRTDRQGDLWTFTFVAPNHYRIKYFTQVDMGTCQSLGRTIEIGTYSVSGTSLELRPASVAHETSICGKPAVIEPGKAEEYEARTYAIIGAILQGYPHGNGATEVTGPGILLRGACAHYETCFHPDTWEYRLQKLTDR